MILITGGMGFIGVHLARRFVDIGEEVVLTYNRTWRLPSFLEGEVDKGVHTERVDVRNPHDLLNVGRKYDITNICHMAVPGLGAVPPVEEYQISAYGLLNVLDMAKTWKNVKRVTLASSQAVYRGVAEGPFREDMPLPVESVSGTETYKKIWEGAGQFLAQQMGLDVVAIRIAGIWGPLFYHAMPAMPMRLVGVTAKAAADGVAPDYGAMPGGAPFAEGGTDLCYVKDCAIGIQMLQMADKLEQSVYNLGSGRAISQTEVAEAVTAAVPDAKTPLQDGRNPAAKPNGYMDLSRISQELNFEHEWGLERGVADYIEWLRGNPL